jgi:hypothetical protein
MLFEEHNEVAVAVVSAPHCADMGCEADNTVATVSKPHCADMGCEG